MPSTITDRARSLTRFDLSPRHRPPRASVVGIVAAVCLLPDLYIWLLGQSGRAVLVLVAMHLAIGLITYNLLVRLAPVRPAPGKIL